MLVQTLEPRIDASPFICQPDGSTVTEMKAKPQSTCKERAMLHLPHGSTRSSDKEREETDLDWTRV